MADPTGLGVGAGGGAAAAAIVYLLDKFLGSGKTVKSLDEQFKALKEDFEKEFKALLVLAERSTAFTEKLFDMHNVADPDDPSGKIWYFSVTLRRIVTSLDTRMSRLLDLLEELERRFRNYNETLEKLVTVIERLDKDVTALGIMVGGMDNRGRH